VKRNEILLNIDKNLLKTEDSFIDKLGEEVKEKYEDPKIKYERNLKKVDLYVKMAKLDEKQKADAFQKIGENVNKVVGVYSKKEEEYERILRLNKIENFDFNKLGVGEKVLTKQYFNELRNILKEKEIIKKQEV